MFVIPPSTFGPVLLRPFQHWLWAQLNACAGHYRNEVQCSKKHSRGVALETEPEAGRCLVLCGTPRLDQMAGTLSWAACEPQCASETGLEMDAQLAVCVAPRTKMW